ncbi:unnamed protein product [Pedinophyceae sp. YPF-701]|nr:unnamed protein product [Pedinophyceae sp. YPF-701]
MAVAAQQTASTARTPQRLPGRGAARGRPSLCRAGGRWPCTAGGPRGGAVGLAASASSRDTVSVADLFFDEVHIDDLDRINALEQDGYPADEAASYANLKFRIENAGTLFMGAVSSEVPSNTTDEGAGDALVGYVCGTLTKSGELTHESMSKHEPGGQTLCIHSVCVEAHLRRRGIATRMLRVYPSFVKASQPQVRHLRLICKEDLIGLYEGAGFRVIGPSPVVHGQDPWTEMGLEMDDADAELRRGEVLGRKRRTWYF